MSRWEVARRLASLYDVIGVRWYVRAKVMTDPIYPAVAGRLQGADEPLIDLGCGVGLLPFFLREQGFRAPIIGVDFDRRKIEIARRAATRYRDLDFIAADARESLPDHHNVVLLDLLHYLDSDTQRQLLANAARVARVVIIRQGIRDESWRYRFTAWVDAIGRSVRWMKAENLNYPTREEIAAAFAGFDAQIVPLWGRTPYNNYLFVFRRAASSGTTNA